MERYNKTIKTEELKEVANHIFQNALGNISIRNEAPTATTIKANQFEFYNDKLYIKLSSGSLYTLSLTAV